MVHTVQRPMTRSPLQLARIALGLGKQALPPFSSQRSRKDFTQAQLLALAVVRIYLRLDYRSFVQLLQEFRELQHVLALPKVPHFTTLQKAEQRLKKGLSTNYSRQHLAELKSLVSWTKIPT